MIWGGMLQIKLKINLNLGNKLKIKMILGFFYISIDTKKEGD